MFKRLTITMATVLVVLMAVGIGSAVVGPGTDNSAATSSTTSTTPTTPPAPGPTETIIYEVGDAGTVTVASDGAALSIAAIAAAPGWAAEVEVAAGREVEADFRNGTRRIQFNAELEDGQIKVRVRERADDDGSADNSTTTTTPTTTTVPATTTSTTTPPGGDDSGTTVTYWAGDGGTVTITVSGSSLTIVSVDPAAGWSAEIEVHSGREVEADFRNGTRRIQFNAEFEDGEVRIRVRDRMDDDNSGDDNSDDGSDDDDDKNGGHGNGHDDDDDDGDDNSGHGNSHDDDDDTRSV